MCGVCLGLPPPCSKLCDTRVVADMLPPFLRDPDESVVQLPPKKTSVRVFLPWLLVACGSVVLVQRTEVKALEDPALVRRCAMH